MTTAYLDNRASRSSRRRRVTIGEVADSLGLAKGTVSRAMNNYPDISDSTRQRVKREAERMGYRPLSQAQAIRTGRTRSIGLVLQVDVYDAQRPFLAEFLAGVTKKASSENWSLTVSTAMSENETLETYERLIDERKADGFILPRTKVNDRRVALLKSAHVPFVLFGRTGDDDDCAWYDILSEQAMSDAVVRLFEFGHRRIAFVKSGMEYYYSTLRLKGYKQGLAKVGLEYDETYVSSEAMTKEQGRVETDRLLRLKEPPTAILYAVDMAALGAYAAAASLGLKIGADLSVIGYDGVPECSYTVPPMTTFEVDTRRAGERLAHLLISRIRGAAAESLRETEFASLNARSSDGPATLSTEELARIVRANSGHENILGGKT